MDYMEELLARKVSRYRKILQQLLRDRGIDSDSKVTDEWILDQICLLIDKNIKP